MSSRGSGANLLDHAIHHGLLRRIEHARGPRPDARRRLLQRAAARAASGRWSALFEDVYPARAAVGLAGAEINFGWRELAMVHAFRPSGVFGALAGQLR